MSSALPTPNDRLSTRLGRDGALDAALERIGGPTHLAGRTASARADTPDLRVTAIRRLPPADAQWMAFPDALDQRLCGALRARGIAELYSHQAEAIELALGRKNVVVVTPTAS